MANTIITRKDYMDNSSELHHAYYAQFVTEATKQFVLNSIGMDKLLASKDGWLNDIKVPRYEGGRRWLWDNSPVNTQLAIKAGECVANPTDSCCTCVGKAAARILLTEELTK